MRRLKQLAALLLALLVLALSACAPSSGMVATLTMLPGTPTPTRAIRLTTRTPYPTNTFAPVNARLATATPATPRDCQTSAFDTTLPGDPSLLPGRSYDLNNLPEGYQLVASGPLETEAQAGGRLVWVEVRWEGRSLYWVQQMVCRDAQGHQRWEIIDALALPRLDPQSGEAQTRLCYYGARRAPDALAFGMFDPSQPPTPLEDGSLAYPVQVQSAWQIGEGFSTLDTRGLSCYFSEE